MCCWFSLFCVACFLFLILFSFIVYFFVCVFFRCLLFFFCYVFPRATARAALFCERRRRSSPPRTSGVLASAAMVGVFFKSFDSVDLANLICSSEQAVVFEVTEYLAVASSLQLSRGILAAIAKGWVQQLEDAGIR